MNQQAIFISVAAIVALTAAQLEAQVDVNYFWQGGSGQLTDANYFNSTTNTGGQPPGGGVDDFMWYGADSTTTISGTSIGLPHLRIGHNGATSPGAGTVTVTNGGELNLTQGLAGINNAALWVGNARNGTLNIEESGFVTVSRLLQIGVGSNQSFTGTVNVRTGGILTVTAGDIIMGDATGANGNGVPANLTISDPDSIITVSGGGADLDMAPRLANCVYNQTDGIVTINDLVQVTTARSRSTATSFTISGGSFTTGTGDDGTPGTENFGNFFVGRGASENATVNISGTATLNVGHRYLMGGSADTGTMSGQLPAGSFAKGIVTNHAGGTLNVDRDIRIADVNTSATSDSTYYLSGNGILNTNVASYTADSSSVIGRQGIGKFIQSGGTANFNSPLVVGNREAATTTTANGLYEISAGDLNINAPTPTWPLALNIAPSGTGEFRVVGDDATIDVTGDFAISSTANGTGTLAAELETGDVLSLINVTGIATFNVDSILSFDVANAAPTQSSYDVLTALDIVDNGLDFSGPAGWGFEIVGGGNGEILRLVQGAAPVLTGDHNQDGVVNAADYVMWRKTNINGATGYSDWVEQFGQSSPGSGGQAAGGPVPEPAAAMLVVMGLFALANRRGHFAVPRT